MNEEKLTEKIKRIEALFAGATTDGERDAAFNALQKIRDRLNEIKREDPPVEYKFTMTDIYSKKLLLALLRRYDIKPYRYYRQRYTPLSWQKCPKVLWMKHYGLNLKSWIKL